jgi:hypothetical protein
VPSLNTEKIIQLARRTATEVVVEIIRRGPLPTVFCDASFFDGGTVANHADAELFRSCDSYRFCEVVQQ